MGELTPGMKHFVDSYFCLSADLGQAQDPTAICVMEHQHHSHVTIKGKLIKDWEQYHVRHLERAPLGMPYPDVVLHVIALLARPPLNIRTPLILDDTGVGRAVSDIFVERGLQPVRVTIVAGDTLTAHGGKRWNVPKGQMISLLDAKLHLGELKIAASLAEAPALREEMKDFQRSVTAAGRATFAARVGKHDDIVLAVAQALWFFAGRPRQQVAQVLQAHIV